VNIHTAANPAGEIRGQITISGGRGFDARLTGSQEVGPVVTPGLGTAAFTLADIGMVFRLTGNDLMGALTDAHFHDAPPGVNGPIVRSIIGEFVSQTGDGVWKPTDASPLTPALLASLLRGDLYVNLHTAAVPTGEIRGQIGSRSTVAVGPPVWSSPGIDLAQAPNPLTGRGRISFRLSRPAAVRLTLHDLSGAEVARLVDGWREAGAQEVPLEAGRLPAGVYFYLLRTPEGEGRGKMVVLD
jgi:hypothetical protein